MTIPPASDSACETVGFILSYLFARCQQRRPLLQKFRRQNAENEEKTRGGPLRIAGESDIMKSERQALLLFRNRMQDKHTYLTETPIPRLIPALAVPTVISMLVTGIYNSADTYFVGRISTQATAAVGLVFSVMAVIQALGFFCGQGSGTLLSRDRKSVV